MRYGEMLKAAREKAGKSVEAVAAEVGLSTSYMRDVELGRRGSLRPEHTRRIARAVGVDSGPLMRAAMLERDVIQLDMRGSEAHRLLGERLLAAWDLLTDAEALALVAALDEMRLPTGGRVGGG
jgi:transcriptional regulator with XRE-family HTH domain